MPAHNHRDHVIAPNSLGRPCMFKYALHHSWQQLTCLRRTRRLPQAYPQEASQNGAHEEVSGPAFCLQVAPHPAPPVAGNQAGPAGLAFYLPAWCLSITVEGAHWVKSQLWCVTCSLIKSRVLVKMSTLFPTIYLQAIYSHVKWLNSCDLSCLQPCFNELNLVVGKFTCNGWAK